MFKQGLTYFSDLFNHYQTKSAEAENSSKNIGQQAVLCKKIVKMNRNFLGEAISDDSETDSFLSDEDEDVIGEDDDQPLMAPTKQWDVFEVSIVSRKKYPKFELRHI